MKMFSKIKRLGSTPCQVQITIDIGELIILEKRNDISLLCIQFERNSISICSSSQLWSDCTSPSRIKFHESLVLSTTLYRDTSGRFLEKSGNLVLTGYSTITSSSVKLAFATLKLNLLAADYVPQRFTLQLVDGKGKKVGSIKSSITAKYIRDAAAGDDESSITSGSSVHYPIPSTSEKVHHGLVYKESTPELYSEASKSVTDDYRKSIAAAVIPNSSLPISVGDTNEDCELDDIYQPMVPPHQGCKFPFCVPIKGGETLQTVMEEDVIPAAISTSECKYDQCIRIRNTHQSTDVLALLTKIRELQAEIDELNGCYYLSEKNLIISTERADRSLLITSQSRIENESLRDNIKEANDYITILLKDKGDVVRELQESVDRESASKDIIRDLRVGIEIAQSESAAVQAAVLTIELQRLQTILERMREQAAVSLTEKSGLMSELENVRCLLADLENKDKVGTPTKLRELEEKERNREQLSDSLKEIKRLQSLLTDSLYQARVKEAEMTEKLRDNSVAEACRYDAAIAKHRDKVALLNDTQKISKKCLDTLSAEHSVIQIKLQNQERLVSEYADKLHKKEISYLEIRNALAESDKQIIAITDQLNNVKCSVNDDEQLRIEEMREKIIGFESSNATISMSLVALQTDLIDSRLLVKRKDEEIQGMNQYMKDAEDELIKKSNVLSEDVLLLNEVIRNLRSEIKLCEMKNSTLQIELRNNKESHEAKRSTEMNPLQAQISQLTVEKTEAAAATTAALAIVDRQKSRLKEERDKNDERMAEMKVLEEQISQLTVEKTEAAAATTAALAIVDRQKSRLKEERDKLSSISQSGDERMAEMKVLEEQISSLKAEKTEAAAATVAALAIVDGTKSEMRAEKERAKEYEAKRAREKAELEAQISSLKAEKTEAAAATVAALASVDGTKSEMRAEKERAKEDEAKRAREKAELEAQISSLKAEKALVVSSFSTKQLSVENEIICGKKLVCDLNESLLSLNSQFDKYRSDSCESEKVLKDRANVFHSQAELYKSEMENVRKLDKENMESIIAEKLEAVNELASFKIEMNEEIDEYSSENEELRRQIENLNSLVAAAESKQFNLVESYELELKRVSALGDKAIEEKIKEITDGFLKSNKALKDEIEVLTESYVWMQNDYAETKTDYSILEEKMEELESVNSAERSRYENQIILLLKAIGIYDSSLDPRDTYFVELFRLQLDEERMKIFTLKNCLVKFSENLSEADNTSLLQAGIILAQDVTGI